VALKTYLDKKLTERSLLLMTHAVVGYPSLEDNWEMLTCMQEAGVDLVELQLPFSEPIADGPMFIKANQSALEHGIHWHQYFEFAARAVEKFDFPVLFMGYYNSVFRMGHENFCNRLQEAGMDGFIIADLPTEEALELDGYAKEKKLDPIHIMTPVNSVQRMKEIAATASGFIYCVARKGVTGRETDLDQSLREYMQRRRKVTDLPLALGFGIKKPEHVSQLKGLADIAIVGTACLEVWEQRDEDRYRKFLEDLHNATL
jgi:tryptophan synthase alpha chain